MKNIILVILISCIVAPIPVLANNTTTTASNGNSTTYYTSGVIVGQSTKSGSTVNYSFRSPTTGQVSYGRAISNGNTSAYYDGNSVLVGTSTSTGATHTYTHIDD